MQPRFDFSGHWFKGNTHTHSTASDGHKTAAELVSLYRSTGHDFLFITDHWQPLSARTGIQENGLLLLGGMEIHGMEGSIYHVACLGDVSGISQEIGFVRALRRAFENGAIVILAHPHWSGNTTEDLVRYPFHGVEIYNHIAQWQNGKSSGLSHWDCLLEHNREVSGFAVDDAHFSPRDPVFNGGWIWVNAPVLDEPSIMQAIKSGNFYSSRGPRLLSLALEGDRLLFESSEIQCARLVGSTWHGAPIGLQTPPGLTSGQFKLPRDFSYIRLELEDFAGRCAWTNVLFA